MDNYSCFLVLALIYATKGLQQVLVAPRQDVTLACRTGAVQNISVLKWSRPDLDAHGYVYFYRNRRCFQSYQHPRFHGRVALRDAAMTDGDASLVLRNATQEDAGIYQCHLQLTGPADGGRSEVSRFIDLTVAEPAQDAVRNGVRNSVRNRLVQPEDGDTPSGEAAGGNSVAVAVALEIKLVVIQSCSKTDSALGSYVFLTLTALSALPEVSEP
ncbi:uncharacterized protein V3H82_014120 [Fundulus diaphanus]